MFEPRYWGTTFDVRATCDPGDKPSVCHVVTSNDAFELISQDWKQSEHRFRAGEVVSAETNKNAVVVTMMEGCPTKSVTLEPLVPIKRDRLQQALSTIMKEKQPAIQYLALESVLPNFRLDKAQTMSLHKAIMDQAGKLLQSFQWGKYKYSQATTGPFVDLFSCLYRFRYTNDAARDTQGNVQALDLLIRRHLIVVWCNSLCKVWQPNPKTPMSANGKVFWARLATNLMNTITKVAATMSLPCDELYQAVTEFTNSGNGEGVAPAAKRLAESVKQEIDNGLRQQTPFDLTNMKMFLNITLIVMSGTIAGLYLPELEALDKEVILYTKVAVNGSDAGQARKKLDGARQRFLSELLMLLDGQRYEEPFQYVFCIWDLLQDEGNRLTAFD